MQSREYTVCLIDPDEAVHDALITLLRTSGVRVVCFTSAENFLGSRAISNSEIDCMLIEASLPGMGSLALMKGIRVQRTDIPIVVLTSTSDCDIAEQALKAGALEVIEKPLLSDRLLQRLLLDSRNSKKTQPSSKRYDFGPIRTGTGFRKTNHKGDNDETR